jgi:DNA-binding transcriptional ArsR family regulator
LKEKIGFVAGDILHVLRERDDVPISELRTILSEKPLIVNQALGWLARENKIDYLSKGRTMLVSLSETEKNK